MEQFEAKTVPALVPSRPADSWCLFQCGPTGYAIGLGSVAEVVEVERLVRLPHSPPRVLGLCSLRREVIPVIGLNESASDLPASGGLMVLILRTARGTWGVRINTEGTIVADEALDGSTTARRSLGPAFLGTVRRGEIAYAAIDPDATWQSVRQSVDDCYDDRSGRGHLGGMRNQFSRPDGRLIDGQKRV